MVLQPPPGSPEWLRVAAVTVLVLHVSGGLTGIASGATALIARKGGKVHRVAGKIFFGSMLVMSGIGAVGAAMFPQWTSVVGGVFALYLVITGWAAVLRREGSVGLVDYAAFPLAAGAAVLSMSLGIEGMSSPDGTIEGLPYQPSLVFAALAALAAVCDIRVIVNRGVFGAARITRHLWRMSLAMFIATGSLFLGQPKVFPVWIRHSPVMLLPELAVVGLLLFWLIRVRFLGTPRPRLARRAIENAALRRA
jgi:uncharacterized membrane protein